MRYGGLKERVLAANVALARSGLVVLTFGNASAVDRDAGVVAIKPSGVSYERLAAADVPLVDLATGEVVEGETRPSSDTPTHLALYRAWRDVGGIVHTHSPFATVWAQARLDIPCYGTTHADHFNGAVPVTRPLTTDEIGYEYERATGDVIVETFAALDLDALDRPAVLVASHGPFAWGATVEGAVENAIALEMVAASAYHSVALAGTLEPIASELLEKHFARKHGPSTYYGQPA